MKINSQDLQRNELLQSLETYINSENEQAIMLTGLWGSGKTYFIKNEFVPYLRERTDYTSIYISLNGVSSIEQLSNAITSSVLVQLEGFANPISSREQEKNDANPGLISFLNSLKFGGMFNQVVSLADNGVRVVNYLKKLRKDKLLKNANFNKFVFIIDDCERISETFPINELLGFVSNRLLENYHSKVLMISNEEILQGRYDKFRTIKEKTISKTVRFNGTSEQVVRDIIEGNIKDSKDLKAYVLQSALSVKSLNLRTLKAALIDYQIADNSLRTEGSIEKDKNKLQYLKILWNTIFTLNNAIKSGITPNEENLENSQEIVSEDSPEKRHFEENDISELLQSISKGAFDTFHMVWTKAVVSLVLNDRFSASDFFEDVRKTFDTDNPEFSEEMSKLNSFRRLKDEELEKVEENLLVDSGNESIALNALLRLYDLICQFDEMKIWIPDISESKGQIIKTMKLKKVDFNDAIFSTWKDFTMSPTTTQDLKEVMNMIQKNSKKESNDKGYQDILNGKLYNNYQPLRHDPDEFFEELISRKFLSTHVNDRNMIDNVSSFIKSYPNSNKTQGGMVAAKTFLTQIDKLFEDTSLDKVQSFVFKELKRNTSDYLGK